MFKMCNVPCDVQVELIINNLEGEAKRQIFILSDEERDSAQKIFSVLKELYGDQMPASVLRSLCFSCKQLPSETVPEFTLRRQDLFCKLQKKDPVNMGDVETSFWRGSWIALCVGNKDSRSNQPHSVFYHSKERSQIAEDDPSPAAS